MNVRGIASLFLLASTINASTAEPKPFEAAAIAKMVAPFVDNQTLAVAHLRDARLTPVTVDRLAGLRGLDKAERKTVLERLDGWKTNLERAGIDDVFVTLSSADRHGPIAIVIPAGTVEPKDVGGLFTALHPGFLTGLQTGAKD